MNMPKLDPSRSLSQVFTALAMAFTLFANATAEAQELQPLLDRMERLERDIRTLNIQVTRGDSAAAAVTAASPSGAGALVPPNDVGSAAVARLNVRMDSLERDVRSATGSLEEINFQISQIGKRLDKLVSDVDFRLNRLEGGTGVAPKPAGAAPGAISAVPPAPATAPAVAPVEKAAPAATGNFALGSQTLGTVSAKAVEEVSKQAAKASPAAAGPKAASPIAATTAPAPVASTAPLTAAAPASPPAPAGTTPGVLPTGGTKEKYSYAFNLLRQAKYDEAEVALKEFVQSHGDDPLASNARYWLGETYYVRAAYKEAAEVFFEGFQSDPKGAKAPDTLLKLGMSLAGLDKKREACATFSKLIIDFPDAPATVKATVSRERAKSGCT